jgi:ABC-type glycerol-3-phosphate transport system permease component
MSIINETERRSLKGRLLIGAIYIALLVGSLAMIFPFMITVCGSMNNHFDFERRSPYPRFLFNRGDRFMRTLCEYFPASHRASLQQLRSYFPSLPESWQMWAQIGDERALSDQWAAETLRPLADPRQRQYIETITRDFNDFFQEWPLAETVLAYDNRFVASFLRQHYGSLAELNASWEISINDFFKVSASEWSGEPIDQHGYFPILDTRYRDLLVFRDAYRDNRYSRFLNRRRDLSASYLRPAAMAYTWEEYAGKALAINDAPTLHELPFPVPSDAPAPLQQAWRGYLLERFPLRHVAIEISKARSSRYIQFIRERFHNLDYLNRVMRMDYEDWQDLKDWEQIVLEAQVPAGPIAKIWMDFVQTEVPVDSWQLRDTLPEIGFQRYALSKYGSLEAINRAYGQDYAALEQLRLPYGEALLSSFHQHEWSYTLAQMSASYRTVLDNLFRRGRTVANTIILVALSILITLTVNPLAAYALSRFRMRQSEKIIVFCLATMAFPTAVTAIPGFLLLRDLGLLNTFAALVLPGAANGMTIFLLKGFFDSLPQELFEAATIDGASEVRIFFNVSLPLVKPILAVSMLNAFIAAYNGWEWAIIVCQDPRLWTMSVWTYQFYQTLSGEPYTVMAAFIINSIPVLVVFLFCQKIILRGIILPQMK